MTRTSFRASMALVLVVTQSAVAWAGKCPDVAILLDTSGSMAEDPDNMVPVPPALDKLQYATATIQNKIIAKYDGKLPLGFGSFPTDADCGTGALSVPIAYGTGSAISAKIPQTPGGATPMCTAVAAVAQDAALKDPDRANFIILVTDGIPNCTCDIPSTATAIQNARLQSPPVYTFVVGFGIDAQNHMDLDTLAEAGGVPATNYGQMQKFYNAQDAAGLDAAISQIMDIITGGDAGNGSFCDDSCYQNSCATATNVCVAGECAVNPCDNRICPAGTYCFTDGKTSSCATPCVMSCAANQSCSPTTGMCLANDCGGPCGDGMMCSNKACVKDPLCTPGLCKSGQFCEAGLCKDDPCRYIQCPAGDECVPFTGACTGVDKSLFSRPRMFLHLDIPDGGAVIGGFHCALTHPGQSYAPGAAGSLGTLSLLGLLALYRRTRRRRLSVR